MNNIRIQQQRGAALITSLALLLVMTLIGLSAMNTTTMEEKMTGSVRNKQESFQNTEAVLREGEDRSLILAQNDVQPGSNNWFFDFIDPTDPAYPIWDTSWTDANAWVTTDQQSGNPIVDPNSAHSLLPGYMVEYITDYQQNPNCILNKTPDECNTHIIYRVTARSQGMNDKATTVIQSSYRARR